MIHFAYPNVRTRTTHTTFLGCGRYVSASQKPGDQYYAAHERSIIAEIDRVHAAADLFIREANTAQNRVYEVQDEPKQPYTGNSKHLAYLLALISTVRPLKLHPHTDIWCTGVIDISYDGMAQLLSVYDRGFDAKLDAFLQESNPDQLFIVPEIHIQADHYIRCQSLHTEIVGLSEFQTDTFPKDLEHKIVLKVGLNELDRLISVVFKLGPNPYQGLKAFDKGDANRFFGREQLTEDIWRMYKNLYQPSGIEQEPARLLAILGSSGSGKSSVARAGLLPKLEHDPFPENEVPAVIVCEPGDTPLENLATQFVSAIKHEQPDEVQIREVAESLWQSDEGLTLIAQKLRPKPLVVMIDQFEEIYTSHINQTEQQHFINNLLSAAQNSLVKVCIIIILRDDFIKYTRQHQQLNEIIARSGNHVLIPGMGIAELRTAIQEPAKRAGYFFDGTFVDALLEQTAHNKEGALPLLEFALARIWEGLKNGTVPVKTLKAIDGVGGALAGEAEHTYQQLSETDQRIARHAFLSMVNVGEGVDMKRQIFLTDVVPHQEELNHVHDILMRFANMRLVMLSSDRQGKEIAKITHDALLEHWKTLKAWLQESHADIPLHRRLATVATEWDRQGRPLGSLWRPPNLDLLCDFQKRNAQVMTTVQVDFFKASVLRHQREKRLKWGGIVAIILVAFGAVIWGWRANQTANQLKINQIKDFNQSASSLFRSRFQLEGLLAAVKAGKMLQNTKNPEKLHDETLTNFREIVYSIQEKNRFAESMNIVFDVAFSPDDKWLAAAMGNMIKFWNVADGTKGLELSGHKGQVMGIAFSSDGKLLASGSLDKTVRLWDITEGQAIRALSGHTEMVYSVAFSSDGKLLASGSWDRTVKLWNVADGTLIHTLEGHTGNVLEVAFSPDGTRIASASRDKTIKLWDVTSGKEIKLPFKGTTEDVLRHKEDVLSIAFSPDGKLLASGSIDGTARLWNMPNGKLERTIDMPFNGYKFVSHVTFSPDGKVLATGTIDSTIRLWNLANGNMLKGFRLTGSVIQGVEFNSDGTLLASGCMDRTVKIWNVKDQKELRTLSENIRPILSIAFSPNGAWLASGSEEDRTITLWNVADGRKVKTLSGHNGQVKSIAFSPDGTLLASGSSDATIKLWQLSDGKELRTLAGHADMVSSVVFSPDGKLLASASEENGVIKLWHVADGQELRTFKGHRDMVNSLAFSPDGTRLASASFDDTVKLWDVATGRELSTFSGHTADVYCVVFNPDGKLIASGSEDKTIKLWNVATGKNLTTFTPDTSRDIVWDNLVRTLTFSPDGKLLAAGNNDKVITFWDIATGQRIMSFEGHSDGINSITFSRDGTMFASGSQDATIKLWSMEWNHAGLESLLQDGCAWLKNYLQYNPNVSDDDRKVCQEIGASSPPVVGGVTK